MSQHCLICESSAVLDQQTATAIVQVAAMLNGFVRSWQETKPNHDINNVPLASTFQHLGRAVSSALVASNSHAAFVQDLKKYQFAGFKYQCLRCGALFDSPHDTQSAL